MHQARGSNALSRFALGLPCYVVGFLGSIAIMGLNLWQAVAQLLWPAEKAASPALTIVLPGLTIPWNQFFYAWIGSRLAAMPFTCVLRQHCCSASDFTSWVMRWLLRR